MSKNLICLVGETARGKDTAARYLQNKYNLKPVVSYTTRPKRDGETEGIEHYFIDNFTASHMLATTDGIAAYTKIGNYRYFSIIEELVNSDIYIIDPKGIDSLYIGNNNIIPIIVYVTCSLDVARSRALSRGDDIATFEERVIAEHDQFCTFISQQPWDVIIHNNGSIEDLYKELDNLVTSLTAQKTEKVNQS